LYNNKLTNLFLCKLITAQVVSDELIEEGKNKVIETIYDTYGGITFDISLEEVVNESYIKYFVIQTAYGYQIEPLYTSFAYSIETSEVIKLSSDFVTTNLRGNLYERYSDDVEEPFDVKELIINLNRILYDNAYTLDFDTIEVMEYTKKGKEQFVKITNLPFPNGYNVITAEKQYTLVDSNLVEASFKLMKAKEFIYGVYSKKDISGEVQNAYRILRNS